MKKATAALLLVVASIALVACGGGSSNSGAETGEGGATTEGESGGEAEGGTAASGHTLQIEADPNGNLAYTKTSETVKAGKVTVDFTNPQPLEHDVAIENAAGETVGQTETVAEGSDSTVVELKPGTYTYYCTVPGHRDAGMEGTLVVK